MNSYYSGLGAEILAQIFLLFKGYRKIASNYITGRGTNAGEVDLIVQKSHTLVFVEVKKRRTINDAAYAISSDQQQRIKRAAEVYISRHSEFKDYDIRFDAVLVKFPCSIQHIKNAF